MQIKSCKDSLRKHKHHQEGLCYLAWCLWSHVLGPGVPSPTVSVSPGGPAGCSPAVGGDLSGDEMPTTAKSARPESQWLVSVCVYVEAQR